MPTLAHVTWPKLNIDYGWMFKLSSFGEFQEYWEKVRANRLREGLANYFQSREYASLTGDETSGKNHLTRDDAQLIHGKSLAEAQKDKPRSVVEVFAEGTNDVYRGMVRVLNDKGHIYVNSVGGYMCLSSGLEETETQQVKEYTLPNDKIRIKQWPNGKHYYAYVGNTSVVWNGLNKWSTESSARIAAEKWLEPGVQS